MFKVVLVVIEWAAYAVMAIAIGSVLRIPMPDQPAALAASAYQASAPLQAGARDTASSLLRIAAAPSAPMAQPHPTPAATHSQEEQIRMTVLLTAVGRFKELSLGNYERALLMFATDSAAAKFRQLNEAVWTDTPPRVGWSYFMSSSVHTVAAADRRQPLVAFYNPWSDVFLITEWRLDEDLPRLVDAEMLMGDWLRGGDELNPIPHWLRTDLFKPAALGASVAESVLQFERQFHGNRKARWRDQMAVLHSPQLLVDVNYPAVALMLLTNLQSVHEFRSVKARSNPLKASCRRLATEVVRIGAKGQLANLRERATDTLAQTWSVLKSLDARWFRTLEAVAILSGSDGCMVFLSPVFDTSGSLSLFFKGGKGELRLQRIDVIDYTGHYRSLQEKGDAPNRDVSL